MAEDENLLNGSKNPPGKTHGKIERVKPEKDKSPDKKKPTALGVTVGDDIGTSESH